MQALIDGLLMYSRAGTSEYELEPVDLSALVKTTVTTLHTSLAESGGSVEVDPLPTVRGDATQLSQLFQNLVANAIKFVADKPPRIEISAERQGDCWRFAVADNGIGVEPAHVERIFNVFQRLHGRSAYEGTGMGLAICRKIVERHGGAITARSRPGQGATFVVTLPCRQPHQEATPT
jgi:light-regulated signal transduction histidine kinase (bacteriophytochrome)